MSGSYPTSETWTNFGGDGLASNPANWSTCHAPNPLDSVNFDGGVSNADSYGLDVDSLYVNLPNSTPSGILYTGTVTFTGARTLTALVLETGAVAQAPGVDLSVNYGLQWLAPAT